MKLILIYTKPAPFKLILNSFKASGILARTHYVKLQCCAVVDSATAAFAACKKLSNKLIRSKSLDIICQAEQQS